MNKKNRLLIAAIMTIAVTSTSTFAYFTSESSITGKGTASMLKLKITNGKVAINSAYGDDSTTTTWYYDPVDTTDDGCSPDLVGLGAYATKGPQDATNQNFVTSGTPNRWKKGAPVIGEIKNARPGDGFSMGQILDTTSGETLTSTGKAEGIKITNNSNITVKITVDLKTATGEENDTIGDAAFKQYQLLTKAGWKIKIGNTDIAASTTKENLLTNLKASLSGVTSLKQGEYTTVNMKVYLPVDTNNDYQELTTTDTTYTEGFDITQIFVIKAVQENYE